jgi:hypothetical protein
MFVYHLTVSLVTELYVYENPLCGFRIYFPVNKEAQVCKYSDDYLNVSTNISYYATVS